MHLTEQRPAFDGPIDYSRLEGSPFTRERMRDLETVVVGAGALGNEVVKALGLLGAGKITVIDFDSVSPSDLTRSTLLRSSRYEGRNKAESLAEAARALFPHTQFTAHALRVADVGLGVLQRAPIWWGCVDNDAARLEIAYLSAKLDRPVVDAGLGGTHTAHGRVTWFPGREGACFGCRLREGVRREMLSTWTSERRSCARIAPDAEPYLPSTPTMSAIVGSMQVEIGLRKLFEGGRNAAESIEVTLAPEPKLERIDIPQSPGCPFHEPAGRLVPWPADRPFAELLDGCGPGAAVALDWPLCVEARCGACGHEWRPLARTALVAALPCPACGSDAAQPTNNLDAVRRDAPWAARTPADLRLPADHLYTVVTDSPPG